MKLVLLIADDHCQYFGARPSEQMTISGVDDEIVIMPRESTLIGKGEIDELTYQSQWDLYLQQGYDFVIGTVRSLNDIPDRGDWHRLLAKNGMGALNGARTAWFSAYEGNLRFPSNRLVLALGDTVSRYNEAPLSTPEEQEFRASCLDMVWVALERVYEALGWRK